MQSSTKPIPDGYHNVTPYLTVAGVERLIEFLKSAFDAEQISKHSRPDGTVHHAEVRIGDSRVMLGEAGGEWPSRPSTLYLYVHEVDNIYDQALAAGGKSLREPSNQFYGDRVAGIEDPSGNQWWIATHIEDVTEVEMRRRMREFEEKQARAKA